MANARIILLNIFTLSERFGFLCMQIKCPSSNDGYTVYTLNVFDKRKLYYITFFVVWVFLMFSDIFLLFIFADPFWKSSIFSYWNYFATVASPLEMCHNFIITRDDTYGIFSWTQWIVRCQWSDVSTFGTAANSLEGNATAANMWGHRRPSWVCV